MKNINEDKILKEVQEVIDQLKKDDYFLTQKGFISLVVNLVEEQLKRSKK